MFSLGRSQFIRRILLVVLGLTWVGYLGYLLSNLYRSHSELHTFYREQLLHGVGRRADALEYFFSERSKDLRNLQSGRELKTYFENKALGMSMQYGLSASLYRIREAFDTLRTESRLGQSEIYKRIVFLNADGTLIVDSCPHPGVTSDPGEPASWAPLLANGKSSLQVLGDELVLVDSYEFKSRLTGYLLAWLSVKDIYWHFAGQTDSANRTTALFFASRLLFVPSLQDNLVSQEVLPAIESLSDKTPLHFMAPSDKGSPQAMLAFRRVISGTPLSLVTIIPASKLNRNSPLVLVAVTGSIGILVVLMGIASVVAHRRALQTMEQLFEKMPFAIVVLTKDHHIALANEAAGVILACPTPALKGRDWAEFVPQVQPMFRQSTALDVTAVGNDGKRHAILLTEIPAKIVGQEVVLEAFVDQCEIKRLEAHLRQAQKLEAVGQLAAGIAHEINTPAQFVQNSISFLSDSFRGLQAVLALYRKSLAQVAKQLEHQPLLAELKQAEETADVAYVEENAPDAFARSLDGMARIASIVSAMKEFAHPDHREKAQADLNRALQNTLVITHNEYKYVADVETELAELPLVLCHLSDLNQVFLNLIVNAAHAIADVVGNRGTKGKIRVRSAQEGDQVRVEIHDTGCGIPESIRDRIFDPFFTTKEVGRGSGQGLAIAHSVVVDKHGGSLTFESTVGKGSVFIIRLPIASHASNEAGSDLRTER